MNMNHFPLQILLVKINQKNTNFALTSVAKWKCQRWKIYYVLPCYFWLEDLIFLISFSRMHKTLTITITLTVNLKYKYGKVSLNSCWPKVAFQWGKLLAIYATSLKKMYASTFSSCCNIHFTLVRKIVFYVLRNLLLRKG